MHPSNKQGFTLIEILVTMAIIGILSSIVLPRLQEARELARIAVAEAQLSQIRNAIKLLESDTGQWPNNLEPGVIDGGAANNEVWDLTAADAGLLSTNGSFPDWNGPYTSGVPLDPWGNPYFFDTDYDLDPPNDLWGVVVGSFGPNGVGQNVYDADNIISIVESP